MPGTSLTTYTRSVVLYRSPLAVDSQTGPGVVSSVLCASCWGDFDCAVLLGDAGEEGCGVSVLSLTASSSSCSLCCTEERYCSSRLQSALAAPSTGLSARTVFRESAVPLLRKLSSCSACCSPVDWKPESGKETSVLCAVLGPCAGGRTAAWSKAGAGTWQALTAWVTEASCCSTDCFHCCIDWSYKDSTGWWADRGKHHPKTTTD